MVFPLVVVTSVIFVLGADRKSMFQMLDHAAAGFSTVSARLGAVSHVFVVLELLALHRTLVASLRTPVTSRCRERTLSGGQLGRQRAVLSAVNAGVHRFQMLLFPFCDESRAVLKTRIARHLAFGARLGAFDEVFVVRIGLLGPRFYPGKGNERYEGRKNNRHHS
jgi:hypothetical protein